MKNAINIFSALAILIVSACNADSISQPQREEPSKALNGTRLKGTVPSDLSFYEIVLNPQFHSWVDLDRWYKEQLPLHKDKDYYRSLEAMLFGHLVRDFNIDTDADFETVQYYINKQVEFGPLPQPEYLVRCFKRWENHSSSRFLYQAAFGKYYKDIKDIEAKPDSPYKQVLASRYDIFRQYIDHLNVKFNVKPLEDI